MRIIKCSSNNHFYPNISLSKYIYILIYNHAMYIIIVSRESRMIDKMVHPFARLAFHTRCGNVPWSGTLMAMAATLGRSPPRFPAFPLDDRGGCWEKERERARVSEWERERARGGEGWNGERFVFVRGRGFGGQRDDPWNRPSGRILSTRHGASYQRRRRSPRTYVRV